MKSHLTAIALAVLIIVGMLMLPVIGDLNLKSLFTVIWLVLALLAFGSHLRRAKLFVRQGSSRSSGYHRVRRRA